MTIIIAEIGVNHDGNLGLACDLVRAAADAGADYAKFQTFAAETLTNQQAKKAPYQRDRTGESETQQEMLKKLQLSNWEFQEIVACCEENGIGFLSTAFDRESYIQLEALTELEYIKIPSGEITNLPFVKFLGAQGKKVILSTGMATLGEVEQAITWLEEAGLDRSLITVLHCTSAYPTELEDVNLLAMQSMGNVFGVDFGYSDHTTSVIVASAAVALGAKVIEKHITYNREAKGPDHHASLEPSQFKEMVTGIKSIQAALGDGIKRVTDSEAVNRGVVRKSIVAKERIVAGSIYSEVNLTTKRASGGISAARWDEVVGRAAKFTVEQDEIIVL